jgi:hypothetical protein
MHGIVVAIAGSVVSFVVLLALWRVTIRLARAANSDAIFVSRDWLIQHRENDQP